MQRKWENAFKTHYEYRKENLGFCTFYHFALSHNTRKTRQQEPQNKTLRSHDK